MPSQQSAERTRRARSLLDIHLAAFLFGFPGLFGKWLSLPPALIVLGRVAFASLALGLLLRFGRRSPEANPRGDMPLLVACGVILAGHWTMFFASVQVSTVAVALFAYSTFPVFTAFLEPAVFRERWDPWSLAFALLTVIGIGLVLPGAELRGPVFRGVLWGLGAGLSFAVLAVLNRQLVRRRSSLSVAFYEDLFAALCLLPFAFVLTFRVGPREIGLLALLGVFGTAAAHTLFIRGMTRIPARTASIIASLEPVYGIVLALAFLKEIPSLRTVSGGAVILTAALVVTMKAARTS